MTPRIEQLRKFILENNHAQGRREIDWSSLVFAPNDSRLKRAAESFAAVMEIERQNVRFLPDERLVFTRCVKNLPARYTPDEMAALRKTAYFHELGVVFNLTVDYESALADGLDARRAEALARRDKAAAHNDGEGVEYLDGVISGIDAILALSDAYAEASEAAGMRDVADRLRRVPHGPARSFPDALQFLRILHFSLWCEGTYHNGVGRIDQYLWPYLKADYAAGRLYHESALEWLEEFFLSFNRDSDLYVGVQQGDNGQSLMLGGCDTAGEDAVNPLTEMALEAAAELRLIDPKINLRVSKKTPLSLFEKATELTRLGLGFPQYANDDVVIPGLVRLGYDLKDARNYTVAACWEFVIPGVGMDIPNIDAVSFPKIVDTVLRSDEGAKAETFDEFFALVSNELFEEADRIAEKLSRVDMLPCPVTSMLCADGIEKARDLSCGGKYNHFGIHGTGFATAVDSLAAIRRIVYDEKKVTITQLAGMVDRNFSGDEILLAEVRNCAPKFGNDDPVADQLAVTLLGRFADTWDGRKNCRGGIFRPGTGSAMYYITHAQELPASPDGRLHGVPFPVNYAPSLDIPIKGPLSVFKSFTKPDLIRTVNGGPLTIELSDTVFRSKDSISKVARAVRYFIGLGGHQLQINTLRRAALLDAQKHPERHRHLIVRVWGWSGYFVELDAPYQNQIIRRADMTF